MFVVKQVFVIEKLSFGLTRLLVCVVRSMKSWEVSPRKQVLGSTVSLFTALRSIFPNDLFEYTISQCKYQGRIIHRA